MPLARPLALLALALAVTLAPACGHKGPPRAPRRNTPPSLADFQLAQRGDALEVSCTAPAASVDGVSFRKVDVEFFWGEGQVDLEKAGQQRTVAAPPGSRVVERLPLSAPGTLVRAAARAVVGRSRGQRSLIRALYAQAPLAPPRELGVGLRQRGVTLSWKGAMPEPVAAPVLSRVPTPFGDPFARRRASGTKAPGGVGREVGEDAEGRGAQVEAPAEEEPGPPSEEEPGAPSEETPGTSAEEEPGEPGSSAPGAPAEARAPEQKTPPIHGFRVYRRLESGSFGLPLNSQPQARRVFTDESAPMGRTVCYVVRAVGSVDPLIESAPSSEACLQVKDIVPPGPPSGLAVVPRGGGLEVVWSPATDGGVASYRIYRSTGGGEAERIGEVPVGTTTWLDASGESAVLYRYSVTAVDGAGNEGPPSGSAEGIR